MKGILHRVLLAVALVILAALTGLAAETVMERSFATAAEFDAFFRDASIDLDSAPGAVTLRRDATPPSLPEGTRPTPSAKQGAITSTVIDMADTGRTNGIVPLMKIRSIEIQWRSIVLGDGSVKLEARSGPLPWPDAAWSPWVAADQVLPARFVQVRATITALPGAPAPSLARLTLTARGEMSADAASQGIFLRDLRNPSLVRCGQPFLFQRPAEALSRLREAEQLDALVAAGSNDLDRALLLRDWARSARPSGETHPAVAFIQAALALGYNARPLLLSARPAAEFWCREPGKWVLFELEAPAAEGNAEPLFYRHAATREPLGALDLHLALVRTLKSGGSNALEVVQLRKPGAGAAPVESLMGPTHLDAFKSVCLPLRNTLTDRPELPRKEDSLVWRPAPPLEPDPQPFRTTDRAGDIQWSVHVPRLILTASETRGVISVLADTVTPNLQSFRFAASGREPVLLPGEGSDRDSRRALFAWRLEPGMNTLSVTTLNAFDREGKAATVSVEWKQPPSEETP